MNEVYTKLKDLLDAITGFEQAGMDVAHYQKALQEAKLYVPQRLSSFDEQNKDLFIYSRIGDEPVRPTGLFNSRKKMEEYEQLRLEYTINKEAAELDYLEFYREKRAELDRTDKADKQERLDNATKGLEDANKRFEEFEKLYEEKSFLNDRYNSPEIIVRMMTYFEDDRVDTLREAINLYNEEALKEKEIKLLEDNLMAMSVLMDKYDVRLELVDKHASESVSLANRALNRADAAYSLADRAMMHARNNR